MAKQRRGKIINLASVLAFFGSGVVPSYSVSKGALVQLTKSLAIELAPFNIQVNAIAPGYFETDMTAPVKATPLYQEVIARTPAQAGPMLTIVFLSFSSFYPAPGLAPASLAMGRVTASGERICTAVVKSMVNRVIERRMAKKPPMRSEPPRRPPAH